MKKLLLILFLTSCGTEYRIDDNSAILKGYVISEGSHHIIYEVHEVVESRGINPSGIIFIQLRFPNEGLYAGKYLSVIVSEYGDMYITESIK